MTIGGIEATFVIMFLGSYLAYKPGGLLATRARLPEPHAADPPLRLRHCTALRLERLSGPLLRWLAYGFLLFVLLVKAVGRRLPERPMDLAAVVCLGLLAAPGVFGLAVALLVRCAWCRRRVLIKTMEEPPFPAASGQASDISAGRRLCRRSRSRHGYCKVSI